MADLKLVYGAPTLDDAEYRLEELAESGTVNTLKLQSRGVKIGRNYPPISSIPGKSES